MLKKCLFWSGFLALFLWIDAQAGLDPKVALQSASDAWMVAFGTSTGDVGAALTKMANAFGDVDQKDLGFIKYFVGKNSSSLRKILVVKSLAYADPNTLSNDTLRFNLGQLLGAIASSFVERDLVKDASAL